MDAPTTPREGRKLRTGLGLIAVGLLLAFLSKPTHVEQDSSIAAYVTPDSIDTVEPAPASAETVRTYRKKSHVEIYPNLTWQKPEYRDSRLGATETDDDGDDPEGTMFLRYAKKKLQPLGVCLDGSQPAFWMREGFGSGNRKWMVHLKGGGWCLSDKDCADWVRRGYQSGTGDLAFNMTGKGIMAVNPTKNPEFFNWNMVYVWYCDGGSYTGYKQNPITNNGTEFHVRGTYVLESVIQTLLEDFGMQNGDEMILSGTSAGAMGVMLQCDKVSGMVPKTMSFGCVMDAGFFYNTTDSLGQEGAYTQHWRGVAETHHMEGWMNPHCEEDMHQTSGQHAWKCMLSHVGLHYIKTRVFLIQSATDYWQLDKNFFGNDEEGQDCLANPVTGCTYEKFAQIQWYREQTLELIHSVAQNPKVSMFVDSCFAHSQCDTDKLFSFPTITDESGHATTISAALHRWFSNGKQTRVVDTTPWPHEGQTCAWGPEWLSFMQHNKANLEHDHESEETCVDDAGKCGGDSWTGATSCCDSSYSCYEKDSSYSQCRTSCPSGWACDTSDIDTETCVASHGKCGGGDWTGSSECCDSDETCYTKDSYYSQCRTDCPDDWGCSTVTTADDDNKAKGGKKKSSPSSKSTHEDSTTSTSTTKPSKSSKKAKSSSSDDE